jgi:hypothetical protein
MEEPRARAVVRDIPLFVPGQAIPAVTITGLPGAVSGVWSLWEIGLSAESFVRNRFMAMFLSNDGKVFLPTAKRIWDLLLTEAVAVDSAEREPGIDGLFHASIDAARQHGERIINELRDEHRSWLGGEKERVQYAYDARLRALNKIGLNAVRQHRLKRLEADHQGRLDALDHGSTAVPELNALLMIRVGAVNNSQSRG